MKDRLTLTRTNNCLPFPYVSCRAAVALGLTCLLISFAKGQNHAPRLSDNALSCPDRTYLLPRSRGVGRRHPIRDRLSTVHLCGGGSRGPVGRWHPDL